MSKLYISSSCFKINKKLDFFLNYCQENNINNIELSGVHPYEKINNIIKIINKYKKKLNLIFHNYFPAPKKAIAMNFISKKKNINFNSEKIIKNSILIASKCDVKIYGFHPGYVRDATIKKNGFFNFTGKSFSINEGQKKFITKFKYFYEKNIYKNKKILIGLENLFPQNNGDRNSIMCTFEEVNEIFSNIKYKNVFLLLDLGHLGISSNILNFDRFKFLENIAKKFADRLMEVHLSENDDHNDTHDRIKKNSWQIDAIKILRKINKKIIFTLESRNLDIKQIKEDKKFLEKFIK